MKKYKTYFIILTIFFVFFTETQTFASPIDIDNIKKYDFDAPGDLPNQNSPVSKSVTTFLIYLLSFIFISILAYFTTRWIGKHQMKLSIKSKYMEVIDSLSLGGEKRLYIVKSPQGLLILGATKEGIHLLERIGSEEAELIRQAESNHEGDDNKGFAVYLNNYLNKVKVISEQNKYGGSK